MSLPAKIETIANIATIGAAAVLSVVLIKVYLVAAPSPRVPQAMAPAVATTSVGTSLKGQLPGVDWSKNGRTLVLAISTQCHFCKESTPFYRRLEQEAGKAVKMVAVLPQPAPEAEQYLKDEGLRVDQVKQVALGTIGVRGTPTMLLVDAKGGGDQGLDRKAPGAGRGPGTGHPAQGALLMRRRMKGKDQSP